MSRELEKYQLVEQSINKKFHKALWRPFINAMKQYELVQAGDRIAACISGGKDSFLNAKLLAYADEIESAVMVVHGEKAHSRYFGETAFKMLKGDNKELLIVPGASHCDLYDGGGKNAIPFDKIEAFYRKNLK